MSQDALPFHQFSRNKRSPKQHKDKKQLLSAEQEQELVRKMIEEGCEKSREELIMAYQPLAMTMAYEAYVRGRVSRQDLESTAKLALIESLRTFDPKFGTRISTHAHFTIKSDLMDFVMRNSGPCRVGTNIDDKRIFTGLRSRINKLERQRPYGLTQDDYQDIANGLGVRIEAVMRMLPRLFSNDVRVMHSDAMSDEEQESGLGGAVIATEGEQEKHQFHIDCSKILRDIELWALDNHTGRDREIILALVRMRKGKGVLEELSQKHDISVERVRQIQREARDKIKSYLQEKHGIQSVDDIADI